MSKILTLLILLTTFGTAALAQKGSVKGKLTDSTYKEVLSEATVSIYSIKDSSVIAFGISNAKGEFEIKNLDTGTFRLSITYQGYQPVTKRISIKTEQPTLDLATIYMDKRTTLLDEVVVEAPPIQVKKDTIEFKASAFKTKPNSTAEDVLKKVPGIQVDKEGNVKAQGEDVQKVYVDGKEFFGSDPKLATKNITADMIESVQVFDDMSDQAKFTRIDDGSRSKTINIRLKKDKRKGYFGRAVVGGGYSEENKDFRYDGSFNFSRFNGDRRISVLGQFNNINKQSFSFNDISGGGGGGNRGGGGGFGGGGFGGFGGGGGGGGGFRGGGGGGMGFGLLSNGASGGITKTLSGGINYTDKWSSKVDVTGSYFYSNTNNHAEQIIRQQTDLSKSVRGKIIPDSASVQDEQAFTDTKNQNHRFSLRIEAAIDSMNSILYTPTATFQQSQTANYQEDTIYRYSPANKGSYLANTIQTRSYSERKGYNVNNNLLYRRKFNKPGRTFTLGLNNSINNNETDSKNYSPIRSYAFDGTLIQDSLQDFISNSTTKSTSTVISTSYTEPIGHNKIIELNYAYTNSHNTSDRLAYNFDSIGSKGYTIPNLAQTNYFENDNIRHRAGANFRVQTNKYNFQIGGAVESSDLTNRTVRPLTSKDTTVNQNFFNFQPIARLNFTFTRTKNLRISYMGRTNQPSITQLQDAPDFSNQFSVTNGNPFLKQEYSNYVNLNYSTFNISTFKLFSANLNFSNTSNKIVNNVDTVPDRFKKYNNTPGASYIVPVNLNGSFSASSFVTMGFPLKGALKGSNLNFNNNASYNRNAGIQSGLTYFTNTFAMTQTASIHIDYKGLNVGVNGSFTYNNINYSGNYSGAAEQVYYTQNYGLDFNYTFFKKLIYSSDFDYIINSGRGGEFDQNIPLWNTSLAMLLFKKKEGEIKFSVNDLLNQNQSINRTVDGLNIKDTRSLVLKRYFMLTFTYNLNRAGAQNQQRGPGGGDMPRQFRMMRN
ncbi:TonB-dependent receptor [Paraflavitalea sp. CAU 1676]|uniref:TonB-dependent receptor n=1 Tax=Paraflavitalea sp. CAU 1676 TaxID=3032598 RepID=UPI0023DC8520|nr:TonB-dependent receptor [Paraflavitalea sp. CAU 1676]MDF2190941.1 TonB-dependent receptor [Paraflavitalea sp. CAU 1676]